MARWEDLISIPDVGPTTAVSVIEFVTDQKNVAEVSKLVVMGRISLSGSEGPSGAKFAKMQFVITGSFKTHTREELTHSIEAEGGRVSGKVTPKTNYLIAGEGGGGKLADATRLDIKIINEGQLTLMLQD